MADKSDSLSQAIASARDLVRQEVAPKVPGFSVAVSARGRMVWSEAFGYSDLKNKTPVTRATRFRVGSVSKPLTAVGLALLVERGLIDLDAPIQKYVPDYPKNDHTITPRLLAGHLSGIRNYRKLEAVSNIPYPNLRSGLKVFENDPLETTPGTKFSYASYNWNALGAVMEVAAEQNFVDYMEKAVLTPLGLADTRHDMAGAEDPQRAQFYEMGPKGTFFESPPVNLSYCWPAGGYLSTAEDMVRFGSAHFRGDFLKPESLRLLFTSQTTTEGKKTHNGVGWFLGPGVAFHGGDSRGGVAILLLAFKSQIAVALAANCGQGILNNALKLGKVPADAKKLLLNKEMVAVKIAKAFAPLFQPAAHGNNNF